MFWFPRWVVCRHTPGTYWLLGLTDVKWYRIGTHFCLKSKKKKNTHHSNNNSNSRDDGRRSDFASNNHQKYIMFLWKGAILFKKKKTPNNEHNYLFCVRDKLRAFEGGIRCYMYTIHAYYLLARSCAHKRHLTPKIILSEPILRVCTCGGGSTTTVYGRRRYMCSVVNFCFFFFSPFFLSSV